jgi:glycosyltransferase involved in cell wall biosynthesis
MPVPGEETRRFAHGSAQETPCRASGFGGKTMRIGFDVSCLSVPKSGVGTYTSNLMEKLSSQPADEIVPLAPRALQVGNGHGAGRGSFRLNKTLWMQAALPWQLTRLRLDVCHFTNSVAPLWTPCPSVITIHDMTLWLYPQFHYWARILTMRPIIPLAARRAHAIIAVSHSTKRDIVRILGVPENKVHVVHEAPSDAFRRLSPGPEVDALLRRHQVPRPFVLFVGTIEPRKNLVRLLEAFALLRNTGSIPHRLVLVGNRGWKDREIFATVERLSLTRDVQFLGYVSQAELVGLYNQADALAFPSSYEGFGLPVLEAMACGTPVVTSRNSSLEEVGGDAAEYVDASSIESIAAGLRRVLLDRDRGAELRAKGLAHVKSFSWAEAAAKTRRLYERMLAEHGFEDGSSGRVEESFN